jgi:hypothetical protein
MQTVMSIDERWTPFRRQMPRESKPAEILWTLVKGTESRRADLRDHGAGAELQIYVNGEFVNGQRFDNRALALLQADALRDAFEAAGWM